MHACMYAYTDATCYIHDDKTKKALYWWQYDDNKVYIQTKYFSDVWKGISHKIPKYHFKYILMDVLNNKRFSGKVIIFIPTRCH